MNNIKKEVRKSLTRLELSNKPKLIITEKLQKQIDYLHEKVGRNEWSGELITREEGNITSMDDWTIIAEDIFLADVGTAGFTSYEVDKGGFKAVDIVQMYDEFPGLLDGTQKNHHIHTHHNMGAFFSGTDWENLEDRAMTSNYFMMLIVDFKGDYKAKVAFRAMKKFPNEAELELVNNQDGYAPIVLNSSKSNTEVLVVMDCDIEYEKDSVTVEEKFKTRFKEVSEATKPKMGTVVTHYSTGSTFHQETDKAHQQGRLWRDVQEDWDWDSDQGKPVRKIQDMTDKEFRKFINEEEVEVIKWDVRHAKILLNAMNSDTVQHDAKTWPIDYLNKKHLYGLERTEWLADYQLVLDDKMEQLWPGITLEDELALIQTTREFLKHYQYIDLVKDIFKILDAKEDDLLDELITTSGKITD